MNKNKTDHDKVVNAMVLWKGSMPSFHLLLCGLVIGIFGCTPDTDKISEDIEVEPGLKVELVVAEPLVIDPVAYAFDEAGKLYVVENRGYPDPAEGGTPALREGRIV